MYRVKWSTTLANRSLPTLQTYCITWIPRRSKYDFVVRDSVYMVSPDARIDDWSFPMWHYVGQHDEKLSEQNVYFRMPLNNLGHY